MAKGFKWNDNAIENVKAELRREVLKQTYALDAEIKTQVLSTPKTGRIYRRNSVTHQASAPGEPWASDTGATINQFRVSTEDDGFTGVVTGDENARRLEHGTSRIQPRPTMRPALSNRQKDIETGFRDAVKRGLNKK